ncbi:hypothetical protein TRICI_003190 [Trichomonascus ciferrii]|uniref:S1 motif domain-containing protein n=1 Tax=Trichomonascus ciferrii TaxID=44093 RepID=A0A642V4L2_9ASCO|nr:hypothetical protein TRICI_003190 [Trichomonascus ciferrii]
MDALQELEVLSLVSKLTTEIQNYTGISDKTLAEFLLDLHDQSIGNDGGGQSKDQLARFRKSLDEVGADFPEDFVENIDRLIFQMHPKHKKKKNHEHSNNKNPLPESKEDNGTKRTINEKEKVFRGLALPDDLDHARKVMEEEDRARERSKSPKRAPWRERERYRDRTPPQKEFYDDPEVGHIYDAEIRNITSYGAFATLQGFRTKVDGKFSIRRTSTWVLWIVSEKEETSVVRRKIN